jgi:hypothetical protein
LLWLDGIELDGHDEQGRYFHILCLGPTQGISREMGLARAVESAQAQGALVVLAHPFWTGNSCADVVRFNFQGVEIYNHVCQWLSGKGDGRFFWHEMLHRNAGALAFAADDAHLRPEHPGWDGGWLVIQAPELSAASVMQAIRRGQYYMSCGPEFRSIAYDGTRVQIATSPVQFVRLVGPGCLGERMGNFGEGRLTEATFEMPADWEYGYLEIEDGQGRRAWTNTLFA